MDQALAAILEGRTHLKVALGLLEKRRDCRSEVDLLRSMVGDLAVTISRFSVERVYWTGGELRWRAESWRVSSGLAVAA